MEEKEIKLTAQEMDFISKIIQQLSISPSNSEALFIISICQSILAKIAKVAKEGE